jgi:hypothetical protein
MRICTFIRSSAVAGLVSLLSLGAARAADPAAKPADAGKPAPAAPAADAGKPSAAAAAAAKKIDWEKMSTAQRKSYMKKTVLPEMKKKFVAFDAKKYKEFSCQTCHGEKASENKFKMPNPSLPKLPQPTDRAGFMAIMQKKPEMAKFMGTEVKPTMAALLNLPEWKPESPTGFSCYNCHTKQEAAAAPAAAPAAPGAKAPAAAPAPAGAPSKGW